MSEKELLEELDNFLPGPEFVLNNRMTDLAILQCNSMRFIPEGKWRRRSEQLRSQSPERTMLRMQ